MARKRRGDEGPQPGLVRKLIKLRPETQELLTQVAAFRKEKYIDCLHNLLVEEVQRSTTQMKARIDQLAALRRPPNREEDGG